MNTETPKFVRWAVLLGIVVLINAFTFIGVSYVFEEPEYSDFQPDQLNNCYAPGNACFEAERSSQSAECITCQQEEQAQQRAASEAYEDAREVHAQKAFTAILILGALALVAGIFLQGSSIVAAGLSYGGVIIFIVGALRYLGELDKIMQLIAVGVALVVVIGIAYRKFKD